MKATRTARTPRFYHDGAIEEATELELSKKASHHLVTVVRTKKDERIELFNGDGNNYTAIVADTGQRSPGKRARLQIIDCKVASTESPIVTTLVQAVSRGDRMDITIRQAVELGVNRIQPIYSRQSAKALDEKRTAKKMEHWQNIVISACEQSGRARVPVLEQPQPLATLLEQKGHSPTAEGTSPERIVSLILAPNAESSFSELFSNRSAPVEHCALIIGPESGFDEDEIQMAMGSGVLAVNFGRRILRTETAGPATIAVVQSLLGDLG
ncbi:MAG: 16S rRNA (uracil(1498)-N(3))-methyltransferase [Granulosicoccus sp.]